MKKNRLIGFTILLTIALYLSLVFSLGRYNLSKEQKALITHAKVVSNSLWVLNPELATDYLQLASKLHKYKKLVVTSIPIEDFITVENELEDKVDQFFESLHLLRVMPLKSDVLYKGTAIGKLAVEWYNTSIYTYIYVFILFTLLYTVFWFLAKTIENKRLLEKRVTERTKDLQNEISERIQIEDELRRSESRYRSLTYNLNVGVYRNSGGPEGEFIEANPSIVKMFGFEDRDEFLQTKVSDLYENPSDRKNFTSKILKFGSVKNEELQLRKKSGSLFTASVSAVVMEDEENEVIYFDGIIEDITERKQGEERLRESEEKFRTVLETNPDPVVVYDIEGRVIYYNPAFTRVFGWRLEERIHKKMDIFVPEEAWEETKAMIDWVLAGKSFHGIETRRYTKEREIIPISISGAIYKDQIGNPIGSVINLRDISDQKQMEARLQQAHKMEAIGTLAGGIAHDFNNILVPLVGFAEILKDDFPVESPLKRHVDEIFHAALRAKDLVKQILTFSRQSDPELKPILLQPILSEALKLLRSSIPTTIDIQQHIDPTCGFVIADPTQIHQVVMNLATNAYQAMEKTGGQLKLELKQVRLGSDPLLPLQLISGDYAFLTVADTGTGIQKDIIEKIFNPYFTTKEINKGTGLGLSVVQGIVKSCNGDIQLRSEPGIGTEVQVYLPILGRSVADTQATRAVDIQGGSEKILLVDDEETIVEVEQEMLKRLGYKVTIRKGSVEALEVFKANPGSFDLVITDMTMPNMTGVQLAAKIKNIRPNIPIILCTGFSSQISDENIAALGIQGFVMKPVVIKELNETIRKVLDKLKEH